MGNLVLVGVSTLVAIGLREAQAQSPRFPPVNAVLTRHNDAAVSAFQQWRRDMIAAAGKTIEQRAREDHGRAQGCETNLAMVWAGELRAAELTPLLIRHIDFWIYHKESLPYEDSFPAVRALILIGKSSSAACLAALATEREPIRRKNLLLVIRRVEGEEATIRLVRKSLEDETDVNRKANLRAALELAPAKQASTRP